jgi:hypothetical protein
MYACFCRAAAASIAYELFSRCDLPMDGYFTSGDFEYVYDFNTRAAATMLGTAVHDCSELVLRHIEWAIKHPGEVTATQQKEQPQTKTIRVTISALDKRLAELETLLRSTYEDKVKNLIPEDVCIQLINHYEAERKTKLEQRKKLSSQLEASQEDEKSTDDWLTLIRDYTELETLDRPTLLRLINRIEVGEKYKLDGKTHRDIKIYYNFVGYVEV